MSPRTSCLSSIAPARCRVRQSNRFETRSRSVCDRSIRVAPSTSSGSDRHSSRCSRTASRTDERSLQEASNYVASLEATLGGTELLPALEFVLNQAVRRERVSQLVVMTDGQVTNTDAAIEAVTRRRDRVRVFTFGIGRGASHHLVKGLARAGGGAAEFVYPGERLEPKIVRLFRRALSPALGDVRVDWDGVTVTSVPAALGPVFADEPFRVYGLMDDCADGAVASASSWGRWANLVVSRHTGLPILLRGRLWVSSPRARESVRSKRVARGLRIADRSNANVVRIVP